MSLKGIPPKKLKVLEKEPSQKLLKNAAQLCFLQFVSTYTEGIKNKETPAQHPKLLELRGKYQENFQDPVELPPSRGINGSQNSITTRNRCCQY